MLKIVLDTNIYISAILFGGNSEKILKLASNKKIDLFLSQDILRELSKVLKIKFEWEDWQISQVITELKKISFLVFPQKQLKIIKEKESDNRILELAKEIKADYIVSGDKKHILPLKTFQNTKIVEAVTFLQIIT